MIFRSKSISLYFRGFELSPERVEHLVGVAASKLGTQGAPVKPGVTSVLKRSFVKFSVEFPDDCRLDKMVPGLFDYLGGVDHLCKVRDSISPEFIEVDIVLPIKNSEEQEGGFLPPAVLADLNNLCATLSFQFL